LNTACEFLSHPAENKKKSILLHNHLSNVAHDAKKIAERMNPDAGNDAFVSGLLHDVGKLSPWYQERFIEGKTENVLNFEYGKKQHSSFSAWAARHLAHGMPGLHHIVHAIAGHHGRLQTNPYAPTSTRSKKAQEKMHVNLHKFYKCTSNTDFPNADEWKILKWNRCIERFGGRLNFDSRIKVRNGSLNTYMHSKCVFSSLLQADRGSFHKYKKPKFSMKIQSTSIRCEDSKVNMLRAKFQNTALESYKNNHSANVIIIEAPTGIGKTNLIFRILELHSKANYDRVFYFSPLLALTDGFVMSLLEGNEHSRPAIPEKRDQDLVLEYNHMAVEPISDRFREEGQKFLDSIVSHEQKSAAMYAASSFNYPFIVSTTERLLLTIYSNLASNCIKLASLANSVIIIDEIQTIPKFLLKNLVSALLWISKSSGTKVILVSATIPQEISDMNLVMIKCDHQVAERFTGLTPKTLSMAKSCDPEVVSNAHPSPVAVMFNTRPKAREFYLDNYNMLKDKYARILYLTSGIRKCERLTKIRQILSGAGRDKNTLVVSTQVMEAGVDASFGRVFREMAPLDNIVQAMGRLNRHGGSDVGEITVFGRNPLYPYRGIEIKITQEILDEITREGSRVVPSTTVCSRLRDYYKTVAMRDNESSVWAADLNRFMEEHDYDQVWATFSKARSFYDTVNVILPYSDKTHEVSTDVRLDAVSTELRKMVNGSSKRHRLHVMRRAARVSASFPSPSPEQIKDFLDPELFNAGIYVPRDNDSVVELYDRGIGLDKWVTGGARSC